MKSIIVYYSQTGNTKTIADAIHSGMRRRAQNCDIGHIREVKTGDFQNYDLIGLGSPVWHFQEPIIVKKYIEDMPFLDGRHGFTFCTHGTLPGLYMAKVVAALRDKGLQIIHWNDWYGGSHNELLPTPYYTDGHPDEIDLKEAEEFGASVIDRSRRISQGEDHLIPELPEKEEYDKLYGVPPQRDHGGAEWMEMAHKLKPRWNSELCKYPKCSLCIDHCPTSSIHLTESSPIRTKTCANCSFCEMICPTGAIEIDWESKNEDLSGDFYRELMETLEKYKHFRRFRSLVPFDQIGKGIPLHKAIPTHPRLFIRDGVGVPRRTKKNDPQE